MMVDFKSGHRRLRPLLALALPFVTLAVQAAGETAAPERPGVPDSVSSLTSLGLGLLAVIGIIFGCAWLVRRMSGLTGMNNQVMKVVSVMNLGTRERIALLDVGGKQILVGITPSTIRTLHVFDEPVVSQDAAAPSDFARRLQGMIGKSMKSDRSSGEQS